MSLGHMHRRKPQCPFGNYYSLMLEQRTKTMGTKIHQYLYALTWKMFERSRKQFIQKQSFPPSFCFLAFFNPAKEGGYILIHIKLAWQGKLIAHL
jgi:hypothetical protein